MKAILLSAGYGKRLMPLTKNRPKCLMQIKNKILLDIWIEKLIKVGIKNILINVHYKKEQILSHIKKSKFRSFIKISEEKELLGTAKTLIKNYNFYKTSNVMLIHADNLCLDNLKNFLIAHKKRPKKCLMTMLTFDSTSPENSGIITIDKEGIVKKLYEKKKNPPGKLANGAVYILGKDLTKKLKNRNFKDFSNEVIPRFFGKIYTYKTNEAFIDIGTLKNYKKSQKLL